MARVRLSYLGIKNEFILNLRDHTAAPQWYFLISICRPPIWLVTYLWNRNELKWKSKSNKTGTVWNGDRYLCVQIIFTFSNDPSWYRNWVSLVSNTSGTRQSALASGQKYQNTRPEKNSQMINVTWLNLWAPAKWMNISPPPLFLLLLSMGVFQNSS